MTMDIDTHSFEAVLKRLELRMNEVKFDGISENLTYPPMSDFNTLHYQTRSGIPTRINSTTSATSRLLFPSERKIQIEHRSLR